MDDENVISRYTRGNAIDDGVLVDVTEQAKETGIRVPTVITSHLHQVLGDIFESSAGQDYRGRLHDVLWMTFLKLRAMQENRNDDFPALVEVIIDSKKQTLWALVDSDGLTIMFPEDY
jgi:hypothetical protein